MTSLLLLFLLGQFEFFDDDRTIVSVAPLTTSGITRPSPSSCGFAYEFTVLSDAGMVATPGAGWPALPVEQGTSPTVAATPFYPTPGGSPLYARSAVTSANIAYVLAGHAADAGLAALVTGNHTVQCMFWSDPGVLSPFAYGVYPSSGVYINASETILRGVYSGADGGDAQPSAAVSTVGQWVVGSTRSTGTSFVARANGTTGTVTKSLEVPAPTALNLYLGSRNTGTAPIGGMLAGCTIWPCALTDAELERIEAQWFGGVAESRNVPTTRASTAWDIVASYAYAWGNNAGRVHPTYGLLSFGARTNYGTNSLDASAWSDVGTPIITTNTASGPFSRYAAAAEVDTIEDDGAAYEGKQFASAGTVTDSYTASCWLAAGTSTLARLYVVTDGTGSTGCNFTGLNATYAQKTCTAPITGTPTYIYAQVLVGNTSAATGTILVSQCQFEKAAVAGPPIVCGAASCSTVVDVPTMPSAGLPTTSGKVTLTYTPYATQALARCLLDTIASNNGVRLCLDASDQLVLTLGNGTSTTTTTSAAQAWTGLTSYALEIEWGGGNAFVRKADELVASTTDGTAKVPTAHAASLAYGNLIAGTSPANGYMSKPQWSFR